jgi:hypothetical protein
MIAEKDGSYTINCAKGKAKMSMSNYGLGKTYKTASEAFKDADYATAIQRPPEPEYDLLWGFLGALLFVAVFGYGFWRTIS